IDGTLDLSDVQAPPCLRDCRTDTPVLLDRAVLSSVDLSGLVAPAVSAVWLKLDHYLLLQDVRLDGAEDGWARWTWPRPTSAATSACPAPT
ncbi:MAG: hypothetical protein ABIQ18_36150, partial [Umezawaea sp.]